MIKNNFAVSENQKTEKKLPWLEETVKSYYTFVDKYPKSRYLKEAEKTFNLATELINKLKNEPIKSQNG
ncbi:MAG TPA: hypothetical protein VG603_05830, partial [Chitinophagales bacterium]|nr:hypothetical protein [Chitinophagales bacterium]